MNMDYSKIFELLNQDTEKESNEKAEKAVHDNLYNKGFRNGIAVLDKIRAEIEQNAYPIVYGVNNHEKGMTLYGILQIIDKYKTESEEV